jgi:hypothetical protein
MIFLALLLPMLSLLPLGWLWLWERGWALYWIAGAFTLSVIAFAAQAIALRRTLRQVPEPVEPIDQMAPDPSWTAREQAAWTAVEAIAADVRPSELTDRDRFLNLGLRTIEAVARQIHPQDRNPLWKFTIPEALALVEALAASGKVEAEGEGLRPAGRKVALSSAQKAAWDGILAALAAPASPVRTGKELEEDLGAEVRKVLPLLVSERRLVRFGGDFFLLPATLARLKGILAERRAGGQELLGVPEFKEILGITRKYAMPLLEYLDDLKWTRRQGEGRKILL